MIRIVSTTMRAIRPGEVEGEDYYYISVEEHMRLIRFYKLLRVFRLCVICGISFMLAVNKLLTFELHFSFLFLFFCE